MKGTSAINGTCASKKISLTRISPETESVGLLRNLIRLGVKRILAVFAADQETDAFIGHWRLDAVAAQVGLDVAAEDLLLGFPGGDADALDVIQCCLGHQRFAVRAALEDVVGDTAGIAGATHWIAVFICHDKERVLDVVDDEVVFRDVRILGTGKLAKDLEIEVIEDRAAQAADRPPRSVVKARVTWTALDVSMRSEQAVDLFVALAVEHVEQRNAVGAARILNERVVAVDRPAAERRGRCDLRIRAGVREAQVGEGLDVVGQLIVRPGVDLEAFPRPLEEVERTEVERFSRSAGERRQIAVFLLEDIVAV